MLYPSLPVIFSIRGSIHSRSHSHRIEEPDDAIVKITVCTKAKFHKVLIMIEVIQLAGLCGSDLHIYRGHGEFDKPYAELTLLSLKNVDIDGCSGG